MLGNIYIVTVLTFLAMQSTSCNSDKSEKAFMEGLQKDTIIEFLEIEEKVTISARVWGISGNHEELSISKSDADKSDTIDKVIFFTSEIFFKKCDPDSLIVYVPYSSIKENTQNQIGRVKLVIMTLTYREEIIDYQTNYKAKGLSYLSATNKLYD